MEYPAHFLHNSLRLMKHTVSDLTQKPIALLKRLIGLFTDPDDVVIDPTAGSCSSIVAAASMQRKAYGFEIKKNIYTQGVENLKHWITNDLFEVSPQLENRKKYIQANLF